MRRLIRWAVVLGVLWSLYWAGAAFMLRQAYQGWFEAREAQGWQAEHAGLSLGGYPFVHRVWLNAPSVADPFNGTAWSAQWLQLQSPAIWPGRQTLTVAPGPQRISYFDQTATLQAQEMTAQLVLNPGLDLQLSELSLTSGPWTLTDASGEVTAAQGLTLSMVQDAVSDTAYDVRIEAPEFVPSDAMRGLNARTSDLPDAFDSLILRATVGFERPWDLRALDAGRPQPRQINLHEAEARWGDLLLRVTAELQVQPGGEPNGRVAIRAENWRDALVMLRDAGVLPPELFNAAQQGLGMLAQMTGGPESLDVQLNLRDGFMAVGLIPIGPAPRIILR